MNSGFYHYQPYWTHPQAPRPVAMTAVQRPPAPLQSSAASPLNGIMNQLPAFKPSSPQERRSWVKGFTAMLLLGIGALIAKCFFFPSKKPVSNI